jgi:hypothetical protein
VESRPARAGGVIQSLMLKRFDHRAWATYGSILGPKGPVIVTLERPFTDSFGKMGYIKPGVYPAKRVQSPTFGETFEVTKVPGRSAILFHGGNSAKDSRGCILTGTHFDPVGEHVGIVESQRAFKELMTLLTGVQAFTLHVADF